MFGKQRKTTNANTSNATSEMSNSTKNSNMTSGSRSTKSSSNKAVQSNNAVKSANTKASSKACGGRCKTSNTKSAGNTATKSCS